MKKKILITGAQGFIGSRLLLQLKEQGNEVHGPLFDLFDYRSVEAMVREAQWNTIIHLAAISHVPTCEKDPSLAYKTNLNGTALLVEAVKRHCPDVHLIFASTAQVYAAPTGSEILDGVVFTEERKVRPQNLYAQTKWQSELILKDAAQMYGIPTTVLRLFNHTHQSQAPDFFLPHLYSLLSKASRTEMVNVPVGNLDIYRDIGSLSDLLGALLKVVEMGPKEGFQVFNVCSGKTKSLSKLSTGLAQRLGVSAQFVTDPERVRSGEPKSLCGSHARLSQATGWVPQ